ncbi:hypothetical protein SFC08_04385 [Lysinibacillus halotolerans]
MEKKWNEEVVDLLKDLNDLKTASYTDYTKFIEILYSWIDQYFDKTNFEDSRLLNYQKNSSRISLTVLQKRLVIWVNAAEEVIRINEINDIQEHVTINEFHINTFKSRENKILSRKLLFEILDSFTKSAIENYENERIYI